MKIFFLSAEVTPFAKVGGLGDVAGALPKALAELQLDVAIFMPRYDIIDLSHHPVERIPIPDDWHVGINYQDHRFGILKSRLPGTDVPVYFLENNDFFYRGGIYNGPGGAPFSDEPQRWIFFQKGFLEFCKLLEVRPHVIHCNDNQTALIPAYLRTTYAHDEVFRQTAAVITIHNIAYQGVYPSDTMQSAGFHTNLFYPESPFELDGAVNMLKAGIYFADLITTVSPTYAEEIVSGPEFGYGLENVLASRAGNLFGVLNGIDDTVWNPADDAHIPHPYDVDHIEGKLANKKGLIEYFGLPTEALHDPIVGVISRLVYQKGIDLTVEAIYRCVHLHDNVRFVVLGSGESRLEADLLSLARAHPDKVSLYLGYNNGLAHMIEAGADIFLMPSRFEPCGLNQMYSQRYGTIPVVRATGGLADTVREFNPEQNRGTGFRFTSLDPDDLLAALTRALHFYRDPAIWTILVRNAMRMDFSWRGPAIAYKYLYQKAQQKAAS